MSKSLRGRPSLATVAKLNEYVQKALEVVQAADGGELELAEGWTLKVSEHKYNARAGAVVDVSLVRQCAKYTRTYASATFCPCSNKTAAQVATVIRPMVMKQIAAE